MKNVALTVAVLSLGLAACQDNAADNKASAVNTVEIPPPVEPPLLPSFQTTSLL